MRCMDDVTDPANVAIASSRDMKCGTKLETVEAVEGCGGWATDPTRLADVGNERGESGEVMMGNCEVRSHGTFGLLFHDSGEDKNERSVCALAETVGRAGVATVGLGPGWQRWVWGRVATLEAVTATADVGCDYGVEVKPRVTALARSAVDMAGAEPEAIAIITSDSPTSTTRPVATRWSAE